MDLQTRVTLLSLGKIHAIARAADPVPGHPLAILGSSPVLGAIPIFTTSVLAAISVLTTTPVLVAMSVLTTMPVLTAVPVLTRSRSISRRALVLPTG